WHSGPHSRMPSPHWASSRVQSPLHPSQSAVLPSSQTSDPSITPLPQVSDAEGKVNGGTVGGTPSSSTAWKVRRIFFARSLPTITEHAIGSITAVSRTWPERPGHEDQRARSLVPRRVGFTLIGVAGHPLENVTCPARTWRRSSKGATPPGIRGSPSTTKVPPGHAGRRGLRFASIAVGGWTAMARATRNVTAWIDRLIPHHIPIGMGVGNASTVEVPSNSGRIPSPHGDRHDARLPALRARPRERAAAARIASDPPPAE